MTKLLSAAAIFALTIFIASPAGALTIGGGNNVGADVNTGLGNSNMGLGVNTGLNTNINPNAAANANLNATANTHANSNSYFNSDANTNVRVRNNSNFNRANRANYSYGHRPSRATTSSFLNGDADLSSNNRFRAYNSGLNSSTNFNSNISR